MKHVRLSGVVPVALAPAQALALFTPTGERAWAEGWDPSFPVVREDETESGAVFEIDRPAGRETWICLGVNEGRSVAYARVAPGDRAGLVSVACDPAPDGTTVARVVYDLTALGPSGETALEEFAAGYDAMLEHWAAAIAVALPTP